MTADATPRRSLLRPRGEHEDSRVGFVELFFDLVFVFAVTQLSHSLVHDLTFPTLLETAFLLLAVWWVWIFTAWVTNWLDPQTSLVRLMLFVLMLAGLILAASIPQAFGARAVSFAAAYVFMQVGRSVFACWALRGVQPRNYRNFLRITAWLGVAGVFWIAGALSTDEGRLAAWIVALAIEYAAPASGFRTPGLGRSSTADWDISGAHIAERCGLFVIIALGESLLITGATFAGLRGWSTYDVAGFVIAFAGSVAMWWVYFNVASEHASQRIASHDDPGRLGRVAYTYLHVPIVGGIVLAAVADELVLTPSENHGHWMAVTALIGGPMLFLIGNVLFKRAVFGRFARSHLAGIALLAAAVPLGVTAPAIVLAALAAVVLIVVGVWEHVAVNGRSVKIATP